MTCLKTSDVIGIPDGWEEYDRRILDILGVDLLTLAALSLDRSEVDVRNGLAGRKLAAVSISSGGGVVTGFAESVASIGRHLGMECEVMSKTDGPGMEQAVNWGADFIISADDRRFLVRETSRGRVADNNPATSRVFVAALELMAGGSLVEREVVVLGLGAIGRGAAVRLVELGAYPLMYDPDPKKEAPALSEVKDGEVLRSPEHLARALARTSLIIDATPVSPALPASMWPANPVVSAPGVPLGWPEEWMRPGARGLLWHDPLQSGTAAMLAKLA